jgi:hypothetical protein
MKKSTLIIIAGVIILLGIVVAVFGNALINRRTIANVDDVANIEETLKDINNSETNYIDANYSDVGSDLDTTPATVKEVTTKDKETGLNLVNDALTNTDSSGVDETGGYNINLDNL